MKSLEKRTEDGFTSLRNETRSEIRAVRFEIQTVHAEVAGLNKRMDAAMGVRERFAALEAKIGARAN